MSVQQLSSTYIQSLKARNNGAQLDSFIQNGTIIEKDGKYFVAGKNIQMFANANAFELDETGKPKEYQFGVKGTIVERTTQQKEGQVIKETKKSTFPLAYLVERMKLPEDQVQKLKTFLEQQGFKINDENLIEYTDINKLQTAINSFVTYDTEHFLKPGAEYAEFSADSDPELIEKLKKGENGETPAITEENGRNKVTNRQALNSAIPNEEEATYTPAEPRTVSIKVTTVTTTERKRGDLEVPKDLKNNKDARKKLEAQAREKYTNFAGDPKNRDAVDLYVAESRYVKKINKREQELLRMTDHSGKKTTRNAADVVQLYMDKYANPEHAKAMNDVVVRLMDTENEEDQQNMLEILKRDLKAYGVDQNSKFSDLSPVQKRNAALIAAAEANGTNPKDLLRLMAIQDVMGSRTTEEIANDDAYYIKHQSEDYVKNRQSDQEFPNKNINLDNMGKHGRKLVEKCSQLFGDEISESEFNAHKNDKANYYSAEVLNVRTGNYETKYFKFNNEVWNTFMKVACDPTSANEKDIRLLSDHNMTLQEGRMGLEMRVPTNDGRMEEIRKIIGNSNDNTGNRELNRWRDLVEQTGLSVDSNPTAAKRLWHVVKNAGIGAGMGLLSGGISSLFGAVVSYAGQTAAQTVPYFGKTADRTISYSGVTEGGTMQHSFTVPGQDVNWSFTTDDASYTKWVEETVNVNVGGRTFSETYTAPVTIEVAGQTYEGTVHIDPQTYEYTIEYPGGTYEGTITVEGQEYSGEVTAKEGEKYNGETNNTKEQLRNAAILGGIAGAARGAATMNKENAKGRNTDDVHDFTYMEPDVTVEETDITLQIPQYTSVEYRSGDFEGGAVEEFPAKKWQGPAAYSIMYQDSDGNPVNPREFAKAYQEKIGGKMSNKFFYAFPEIQINGKTFVLRSDYTEQYKKVPEGTKGTVTGVNYANNKQRRHIEATIRRG